MKKTVLFSFVFIIAATVTTQAQITQGSKLIGGNFSFGSTKGEYEGSPAKIKNTSYNINPSFGIAVKENLIAGINLGYYNNKNHNTGVQPESKTSTDRYTVGVFIRKYKQLGKSDFYLFGEGGAYYNASKQKQESGNMVQVNSKIQNIGINLKPGVAYAVNKWLHLEIGLNDLLDAAYSSRKDKTPDPMGDFKAKSFYVSSSVSELTNSLSFGVRILLAK